MKRINIMIGRFQPFTKGHYKCIDEAAKKKDLPTVIAMINTPEDKVDAKHPFPSSLLLPLYKEMFKNDKNVVDIILIKSANIVEAGETLADRGMQIASWTCGTDRVTPYRRMSTNYAEQAGLTDDFELLEVRRTDDDVSATKARQALLDGDKQEFIKLTPRLPLTMSLKRDYYDVLREQILKVV